MKFVPYLTSHMKTDSKWMEDLNIRAKTRQILGDNIGVNFTPWIFNFDINNSLSQIILLCKSTVYTVECLAASLLASTWQRAVAYLPPQYMLQYPARFPLGGKIAS